jgi:uncharacterized membrane protein HdeD (DUF308 family)
MVLVKLFSSKEMQVMKIDEAKLSGLLSIALGILFIVMKQDVITAAMGVLGFVFILSAIIDFVQKAYPFGVIKAAMGVALIIFGFTLVSFALYVFAVLIIIFGFLQIIGIKALAKDKPKFLQILIYSKPVTLCLAGICLLVSQGGALSFAFTLTGILLVASGILLITENRKDNI